MTKIKDAIILNGPGRSGTTLVYQILAYHEDLAWISGWVNKFPFLPGLSVFNSLYTTKLLGLDWHNTRFVPKPAEAYNYWNYLFESYYKSTVQERDKCVERTKLNLSRIIERSSGNRFITKITGDSRKEIFDMLFDNYQVVWIERDPRVVVSSYMKLRWQFRDKPEEFEKMTEKDKIEFYCTYYLKLRKEAKKYDESILVRYEDLTNNKVDFFKKLCHDLGLVYTPKFSKIVSNWPIKEVGWEFYKDKYSPEGIALMHELLKDELKALGYQ
jgi:hypothetical protein